MNEQNNDILGSTTVDVEEATGVWKLPLQPGETAIIIKPAPDGGSGFICRTFHNYIKGGDQYEAMFYNILGRGACILLVDDTELVYAAGAASFQAGETDAAVVSATSAAEPTPEPA